MSFSQQPDKPRQILPGILILSGVLLLFAVRAAWRWDHSPRDLNQLAKDFSSIEAFREPPMVNHAGTLIGMLHNTPKGMGIFIASIPDQAEHTVCEAKDSEDIGEPHVLGWAPDDRTFAYRWSLNLRFANPDGTVSPGEIATPYLKSFTWLSPESCAYIDVNTNAADITQMAVARKIHGIWQETASWPLPTTNGKQRSLLAIGTNTVAWLTDNSIGQMDVTSGAITSLYSNRKSDITSLAYSQDTKKFLLVETAHRAHVSSLFILADGSKILQPTGKFLINDAQWINHGKGYACLMPDGDNTSLLTRDTPGQRERTFFSAGQVVNIGCDGEDSQVFAFASQTNEAPTLWQCDAATGGVSRLTSPWGFADKPVNFQPALVGYAPLPNKHLEKFVLLPPANFSRQKKYPLVIGMQGYDWMNVAHATYSQALANSGVYVALTGYHYARQTTEAMLDYTNNVLAVYNQMAKNPNVDKGRVYLFAFSSSTIVVNHLIDDYPRRWRGIMLFNPTASLPIPKARRFPPILATAGSGEEWLWQQFPAYHEKLAKAGIQMSWYVHPDEGHIEWAQNTMYQRALLMDKMIFGN